MHKYNFATIGTQSKPSFNILVEKIQNLNPNSLLATSLLSFVLNVIFSQDDDFRL